MAAGKGTLEFRPSQCGYSRPDFPCQPGVLWACIWTRHVRTSTSWSPAMASLFTLCPRCPGCTCLVPRPSLPACSAAGTASLYIMLTVEITSRLLFYTAPCQNSPQPSDQDKLNTILAVSIFIPFYKRGRMGGRDPLRCQPSKAPGGCPLPPHSGSPPPFPSSPLGLFIIG